MNDAAKTEIITALERYQQESNGCRVAGAIADFIRATPAWGDRTHAPGHVTASAWIVDRAARRALLVHHRKLDRWLQPGGHLENDQSVAAAALREAREESGLLMLTPASTELFDVDIHEIPARGAFPAHLHYDTRFLFQADSQAPLQCSDESYEVRWWSFRDISPAITDESVLRLVRKTEALR